MIALKALESAFVVLFLAFIVTQVLVPLFKELPLFPLIRKQKKGAK